MSKEPLEYLPRSLNDQYEAFIKIANNDIRQLFKKADYELMYHIMGWQKIEKLLANDYEFLADLFEAASILEMPEQLFGTTRISNLISEYVDASLSSFPHLTDRLAEKYLKLVEFADNKEEFVQNLFKLGTRLGKTKFEDFVSVVCSNVPVFPMNFSEHDSVDKINATIASPNLFFSTMVKYIMEQEGTHLFQKFHADEKFIFIYDYMPKYISIDTVKNFSSFLQANSEMISNNSATLFKLIAITKEPTINKLLVNTEIKLEMPVPISFLITEPSVNPIIKAIVEKIAIFTTLSEEEEIDFLANLIEGLEIVIKNPGIFAILKVAASEDFVIEIYRGALDDGKTSGFYHSKSKVMALGNLEKLISGQSSKAIIEFISTLVHESTNLFLDKLYVNKLEPFAEEDKASKEAFTTIKDGIIKTIGSDEYNVSGLEDALYNGYKPGIYSLEIIGEIL